MFCLQKAQILGYPSHAAFILEKNMAKTPEIVSNFLRDIASRLSPLLKEEIAMMLKYKKEEVSHPISLPGYLELFSP